MASLHREHGQDKTFHITSQYVTTLRANWKLGQDKTRLSSHRISRLDKTFFKIFSRRQSCLVTNSVHTANTDKTRQDSLV